MLSIKRNALMSSIKVKLNHKKLHQTIESDLMPRSTREIFSGDPPRKKLDTIKHKLPSTVDEKPKPRVNEMNIQMLSKAIYEQVFKNVERVTPNSNLIEQCKLNLEKHGMMKETDVADDVNFVVPKLHGNNIEEHFWNIGEEQVKPYRDIIDVLLKEVPPMPECWVMRSGWTRYASNCDPQPVDYPSEDGLIFDVEVCMNSGKAPTLATAVSNKAWYGWVSQSLIDGNSNPVTDQQYSQDVLIPLESSNRIHGYKLNNDLLKPKIIVGHNVSYDRSRIKEQYWLERTGMRFVDTMSLHICVSGVTSYQRAVLKSGKDEVEDESWKSTSSLNSLSEVHGLYCGKTIEKETRNIFVDGTLSQIKSEFHNVMNYCGNDVLATHNVLKTLYPMFVERFPHPVTFAGMLELGTAYLPMNSNWERYNSNSEQTYEDLDIESRLLLARRADHACQLLHGDKYKEDVWMWDLDWEVKDVKIKKLPTKNKAKNAHIEKTVSDDEERFIYTNLSDEKLDFAELEKKFAAVFKTKDFLSAVTTLLPGYPGWYRKLCTKPNSTPDWTPGPHLISTSMQVTPKLLSLTWEGYPLHFIRGLGWGLLVPFSTDTDIERKLPLGQLLLKCPVQTKKPKIGPGDLTNISSQVQENLARKEYYSRVKQDKTDGLYNGTGIWCNTIIEDCCFFFKLPHKDGASHRVGNPLAKDFLNKFSENVLAGDTENAEKVLSIARKLSYWRNNRDRIMEQMVVWLEKEDLPPGIRNDNINYGAIVPQVVVCGTLTRRAMERTWMTASNAHPERVGSELRAMIQAPPGYKIVGADVDSQELWIASVLGDAHFAKMHGCTPLGWMTLSGSKANATDMHSVTAKAVGISRDHAKVINYARIYGAGQNFAERLLKQFNPSISDTEARNKASKMFALTKGKLIYHLKDEYLTDLPDQAYSKWQAFNVAKAHGKGVEDVFLNPKWIGGTESAMFNRLEEIARSPSPVTPFLNGRLSRALEPQSMSGDRFLPTRVNWVVQSGAVDFLHLMLVCMRWLLGNRARFCLSFHDEIRYLVPENFQYQAALAMHVTNLLTRAFCVVRLGLADLPQSVSFFSSVEIDTVLRKESKQDCTTPSNPHGLLKGYGIPNGESLNIYKAIEKANGASKNWYKGRNVQGHKT